MKLVATLAALAAVAKAFEADAPQINVTFYGESYCPDCLNFATTTWWQVWNTAGVGYRAKVGDGKGIINWNMVPYGNARITSDNKTITCQHGTKECIGS